MLKLIGTFFLIVGCYHIVFGQVKGVISNEAGEPLPYATLHLKNSTKGTSANIEGAYSLQLNPGSYDLVFQYLGYEQKTITIDYVGGLLEVNCQLTEQTYDIKTVEIRADAEDPAYAIIRKAIAKRPYYRDYLQSYSTDVYIKGIFRVEEVPKMFLGEFADGEVDDLLDSTGKGILYLSESESRIFFQHPNKRKEQMISSKVSGDSQGFSFNRFGVLDFYKSDITLGRPLINPIGSTALTHYRYRLDRSYYDEENRQINRIEVIPRNPSGPIFSGYIYILEGKWLIHSLDLKLSGNAAKIEVIDTLHIQQQFIPADENYWGLFSQVLDFKINIFGLKFSGNFTGITSNYQINIPFEKGFFDREVVKIEEGSNQKGEAYWDANRPIPLSEEEVKDYAVKDSLADLYASKPYMDSMDVKANKFKFNDVIRGYTYRNSYEGRRYGVGFHTDIYTPVQGFTLGLKGTFSQEWKEVTGKILELSAAYKYGFSDRQHYYTGEIYKRFNAKDQLYFRLKGGHELSDLNPINQIPNVYNASLLLFSRTSINRFYNSRFLQLEAGREIGIGSFLRFYITYDDRREAFNIADFSLARNDDVIPPNNDLGNIDRMVNLSDHRMFHYQFEYTWRPGARFVSYPDRRYYRSSNWPMVKLGYRGGLLNGTTIDFHHFTAAIYKDNLIQSTIGSLSFHVEGGIFPKQPTYYQDYQHFIGGPILLLYPANYLRGFKLLPIYAYSTSDRHLQAQMEWDDNSWLFDKLPYVKKLGLSLVYGASHLYTPDHDTWTELSVGIDRIGYNFIRLLRFDFVWGFQNRQYDQFGVRLGLKVPIQ